MLLQVLLSTTVSLIPRHRCYSWSSRTLQCSTHRRREVLGPRQLLTYAQPLIPLLTVARCLCQDGGQGRSAVQLLPEQLHGFAEPQYDIRTSVDATGNHRLPNALQFHNTEDLHLYRQHSEPSHYASNDEFRNVQEWDSVRNQNSSRGEGLRKGRLLVSHLLASRHWIIAFSRNVEGQADSILDSTTLTSVRRVVIRCTTTSMDRRQRKSTSTSHSGRNRGRGCTHLPKEKDTRTLGQ